LTHSPDFSNGNAHATNTDNNRVVNDVAQGQQFMIPFEIVKEYASNNTPIIPLFPNGDPDCRNIFKKGEMEDILRELPEVLKKLVYDEYGKLQPLKLLAYQPLQPKDFWDDDRIRRQEWSGFACQTGYIASLSSLIPGIDGDTAKARAIVQKFIDKYELNRKAIVQDTPHGGIHLLFKIPIKPEDIETWRKKALGANLCKDDCRIEIKTSTMMITLAPSRHRKDKHLSYAKRGIAALGDLSAVHYDFLVSDLKAEGGIRETPDEYHVRVESESKVDFTPLDPDVERYDLTDSDMEDGIDVILGKDDKGIISGVGSAYIPGHRDDVVISSAGHLFYYRRTLESIKIFIQKLGERAGDSPEDIRNSLRKVERTWKRGINGQRIRGKSGLIETFARLEKDDNKAQAFGQERLTLLTKVLHLQKPGGRGDQKHGGGNDADTLVKIAEKEIPFFFTNHLNRPCAIVQIQQHYEVMEILTDPFLVALRRMWQAAHPNRITISDDMVKRTRSALIAKSINPELQPIKTHLRVAWKDKILRYDLTNTLWQQVEVSSNSGWKILSSKVMLDEIKDYKESGYAKQKMPVFFQRYSNTKEQVLPAENFDSGSGSEHDILDQYFRELTNVTDKRALRAAKRYADHWKTEASMDDNTKILIAKVLLISKFVADIPHFLEGVIGSPGAIKTGYLKHEKRLVDPGITEVFTPPITPKDIKQIFSQNYFVILDNMRVIDDWLSDLICSVITGSGSEKRQLYSDEGIINSVLKSCVAVGSVGRVLTAPDAITRMAVLEFLEVDADKNDNYKSESIVEEKFEEMRPKLLACIFNILSRAIGIRDKIDGRYSLGRMADALSWGEAISQAMGNQEKKFLDAFKILRSIQHTHAAKSDPLLAVYTKFYYEIFEDPDKQAEYEEARCAGWKVFRYNDLQRELNSVAESEGYKINGNGKSSPWPKDSRQLAERTREVASQLRKTSSIMIEIRSSKKTNQYIIGHSEGVENYLQEHEEVMEEKKEDSDVDNTAYQNGDGVDTTKDIAEIVVDTCVLILKERAGEVLKGEDFLQEASRRNPSAKTLIRGRFTVDKNWKLRDIFTMLENQAGIERIGKKPYSLRYNDKFGTSSKAYDGYDAYDVVEMTAPEQSPRDIFSSQPEKYIQTPDPIFASSPPPHHIHHMHHIGQQEHHIPGELGELSNSLSIEYVNSSSPANGECMSTTTTESHPYPRHALGSFVDVSPPKYPSNDWSNGNGNGHSGDRLLPSDFHGGPSPLRNCQRLLSTSQWIDDLESCTRTMVATMTSIAKFEELLTKSGVSQQQLVVLKKIERPLQETIQLQPLPEWLVKAVPALGRFGLADCEWYRNDIQENVSKGIADDIYAFSIASPGKKVKLHVNNYPDRKRFMSAILDEMKNYDTLAGYAIFSDKDFVSDLEHIANNCNEVGLANEFSAITRDEYVIRKSTVRFLDASKIFKNKTVKGFLKAAYKVDYREEGLNAVAKAYVGRGKPEGVSGSNAETLTPDEQLEYCYQDARLCYEILQKNDFELLSILFEIGNEVGLPFFDTCNAGYSSAWWEPKLKSLDYPKVPSDVEQWIAENMTSNKNGKKTGVKYKGGYVPDPKPGLHLNAVSYDVSSMYPTMIREKNISTETINCNCCRDDPKAKIPDEMMSEINDYLKDKKNKAKKQEERPWHYWICRKEGRRGKFVDVMKYLIDKKIEYKQSGQKLKEKAIKILMNSGYGCFGNAYFQYQDPRVAELTTAFGRYTLKQLENFVGKDSMLYGDTDSIYVASENKDIITEASRLGARLEVDKRWQVLCLNPNKKQYFGLMENGELVHTTLPGLKSNQPAYFRKVTNKMISREFQESFIRNGSNTSNDINPKNLLPLDIVSNYLRSAFAKLEHCNIDDLAFSPKADKPLYEYQDKREQHQLYDENLEDCGGNVETAQSISQGKCVYEYWKVISDRRSISRHPEKYKLNMKKYRKGLFACVVPILRAYGISKEEELRLQTELVADDQQSTIGDYIQSHDESS
jgi:DNA polymerase elongation subunit (family B)